MGGSLMSYVSACTIDPKERKTAAKVIVMLEQMKTDAGFMDS